MLSLERWKNLFKKIGCHRIPDEHFYRIIEAYSQKHRAYHNLSHIEQCLGEFDLVKDYLDRPDLVEIAIWYHDVVYNTRSDRNEEDSAIFAERELNELNIIDEKIISVHDLILSTKHQDEPDSSDTKYLVDIDLSIFGKSLHIYQEYENNIRKEYKWVPKFLFQNKRFEILRTFLCKNTIFHTEWFREKYELQARININSILSE